MKNLAEKNLAEKNLAEKIIAVAESLGWYSDILDDDNIQIERHNSYEKDIVFEAPASEFIDELKHRVASYDVSYETYIWLDEYGHGKKGAPYELEDVLNSSKEELKLFKKLLRTLQVLKKACDLGDKEE